MSKANITDTDLNSICMCQVALIDVAWQHLTVWSMDYITWHLNCFWLSLNVPSVVLQIVLALLFFVKFTDTTVVYTIINYLTRPTKRINVAITTQDYLSSDTSTMCMPYQCLHSFFFFCLWLLSFGFCFFASLSVQVLLLSQLVKHDNI